MKLSFIRNFTIISHIDHGKSTLADRFLEVCKALPKDKLFPQYLDQMALEREHGVTIKMHPVSLFYEKDGKEYLLNLIDTPGHVDFSYEVSRAMKAVEGAILLVDATKGIQAQTVSNFERAKKEGLVILPAVNKIDLPQAQIEKTKKELQKLGGFSFEEILEISAKEGKGIDNLLSNIISKIPPPQKTKKGALFLALVFDLSFDEYKGNILFLRIFEGEVKKGDRVYFKNANLEGEVKEVGIFKPHFEEKEKLSSGQIGYIIVGIKKLGKIKVGETVMKLEDKEKIDFVFPGYREPKPVVFSSVFPHPPSTFDQLKKAINKLSLVDPALFFKEQRKKYLGAGFFCGFLGIFHFEIFLERLKKDFNLSLIVAWPNVSFKVKTKRGEEVEITEPEDFPPPELIEEIKEPWVRVEVILPQKYFSNFLAILPFFKAEFKTSEVLGNSFLEDGGVKLKAIISMPFRKMIKGFYERLQNISQGFASFDFEIEEWKKADLVKLEIAILGEKQPSLSKIVDREEAQKEGKKLVKILKEIFPPQLFPVPLQAMIGGKVIARETIKARRRDVTAPLYGGDVTRKMKLLEKQKEGKKKLKERAKLKVPAEVMIELLKREKSF